MPTLRQLELCAYNIESCIIAAQCGASRIELCASPEAGGTTPGYGTIKYAIEHINIPVYVMIRPRGGSFVYSPPELEIIENDIKACKSLGCKGIVTGILTPDNNIDTEKIKRMVTLAYPMGVTFHKAFDETTDMQQALEDIIATGCGRILTSGLCPTALAGAANISKLIAQAAGRIVIMPGGGVRSANIEEIALKTDALEYHTSAITYNNQKYIAEKLEIRTILKKLGI